MFQKIRNNLYLALVFFVLTLGQQYAYYALKGFPINWLPFGKLVTIFIFFFIFSFTPGKIPKFLLLSALMILNFFQMAHLSYFGTLILPNEIFLFFAEYHEITGTLTEELHHIFIPLLFTLVPVLAGYWLMRKRYLTVSFKVVPVLVLLYFAYNPARSYVTGNSWGSQPSTRELGGMNMYLSFSYFMGRILPAKLNQRNYSLAKNDSFNLKITDGKSQWDKVIMVLGESQSPDHMSLYGYHRPTTPFLESLKGNNHFHFLRGLSAGVSTDISVAFFMNFGYGDAGAIRSVKGEHCLVKLAKKANFSTHFLSTQSGQQLRYIAPYLCSGYLDDYRSLEQVSPETENEQAARDRTLLPKLAELLNKPQKAFIILHQRGSHGPWALRSSDEARIFNDSNVDQRINDYDNSVVEFDLFWKELHPLLLAQKEKILVIYLSDHGEAAGKNNKFGHGFLAPTSFEIPMMFFSYNHPLPEKTKELAEYLPHYNLGLYLLRQLGWETNQSPFAIMTDYVIYGNDIDGFAGKAEIKFNHLGGYDYKVVK